MDPNKFSSEHLENKIVTLSYETLSSEDCFETNIQSKFDKPWKFFEQPEEQLMDS